MIRRKLKQIIRQVRWRCSTLKNFAKVEQRRQLALLLSPANYAHFFVSKSTHALLGFCRDAGSQKLIDDGFFSNYEIEFLISKFETVILKSRFLSIQIKILIRNPLPVKSSDVSSAIAARCWAF